MRPLEDHAQDVQEQLQRVQSAIAARDPHAAAVETRRLVTLWEDCFGYAGGTLDAATGFERLWNQP
jgi:hypothetical protein